MQNNRTGKVIANTNLINGTVLSLFFCALLLVYPLIWPRLIYKVNLLGFFEIMTPASVTLLSLAGCCLKINKLKFILKCYPGFAIPSTIIALIALSHSFSVEYISSEAITASLVWIAVPWFAFLYHRPIRKILPWFATLLWILNCWQLVAEQIWNWNTRMLGLTGNNNWSAALMVVSTPFVLYLGYNGLKKKGNMPDMRKFALFAGPVTIVSAIFICFLFSKGANIALMLALIILLLLYYTDFSKRYIRLLVFTGGIISITLLFFILSSNTFASFTTRDVRLPLWYGAFNLILDNPLTGVSPAAFESCFAPYVPLDYYLRGSIAAARNIHPHSHLLYFAASFGIIATFAWCWLISWPVIKQFKYRQQEISPDPILKLCVFALLVLLIHGMIDLTLFSWPGGYIFLIILGILWHDGQPATDEAEISEYSSLRIINVFSFTGAACLLGCSFYYAYLNGVSTYYNRQALIMSKHKKPLTALEYCNKSLACKTTPQALYRAAMIALFDLKKPIKALSYLEQFDATPDTNYQSNNGLRARALCVLQRPDKALPFFKRETENYPLSSINWYFFYYALKGLNLKDAEKMAEENLIYTLKVKGMTRDDMPLLLNNPELDINFLEDDMRTPKIKRLKRKR